MITIKVNKHHFKGSCCSPLKTSDFHNGAEIAKSNNRKVTSYKSSQWSNISICTPQQLVQNDRPARRAPLSQSFTMETMLSFADSSSSQDEADDEEESEDEEEDDEKGTSVKREEDRDACEGRHLSLVRSQFSSQPDLPSFIKVYQAKDQHFVSHFVQVFSHLSYIGFVYFPGPLSWGLFSADLQEKFKRKSGNRGRKKL